MSFGKSFPSFFHLILCLPMYGMCCSKVFLIRFGSRKGKTAVVVVVGGALVIGGGGSLSLAVVNGDGIVLRNDSAT